MLVHRRLASEIAGLRVSRVFRSLSSMIHLDFDPVSASDAPRSQEGSAGRYFLMVELANWSIDLNGRAVATSDSAVSLMDGVLPKLLGKRLQRAAFGEALSVFWFSGGLLLALTCNRAHRESKLDKWAVFRGNTVVLTLSNKGRFTISS